MAQGTSFDLEATSMLWNLAMVDPSDMRRQADCLEAFIENRWISVFHILNRMIAHENRDVLMQQKLFFNAQASWHSHPGWYYRAAKNIMPKLPLSTDEQCRTASAWRELGLPADRLVLKRCSSYGGKDVFMHVSQRHLDTLENPSEWLVQPRYQPRPMLVATDGASLYMEVRCILSIRQDVTPWLMARLVRVFKGEKASSSGFCGSTGVGIGLLYGQPA